jgi:hypothetical protein
MAVFVFIFLSRELNKGVAGKVFPRIAADEY